MSYQLAIRPSRRITLVDFAEIWRYRYLVHILVWRDFVAKYKQTLLGPIWFLLQPLLPTVVFTLVFGNLAKIPTDGLPPFLFFLCNQVAWNYFSNNFSSVSGSLSTNQGIFSKVYFPRLIPAISSLISNLFALGIQLILFAGFCLWYRLTGTASVHVGFEVLLLPTVIALLAVQGLGFGLFMAALTAKYRDLQQISGIVVQLWMYGSAVVFPLSEIPLKYRSLVSANPVTFCDEAARLLLLGQGTVSWVAGLYSAGISVFLLVAGLALFDRTSRKFVDIA